MTGGGVPPIHTQNIWPGAATALESQRRAGLSRPHCGPVAIAKGTSVQDVIWLLVLAGLVAATLAYVRLCDRA